MSDVDHERNPPHRKARGRLTAIALSAVAGIALGGGAYAWKNAQASRSPSSSAIAGQSAIGGAFQLVDQDGRAVDQQLLRGKWSTVFFGYTSCPDFCPATLQTLQAAAAQLGPEARELQTVLITVDPERDTPAVMKSYIEGYEFPGGIRALTGTPAQVDAATKAWRVYHRKAEPRAGHGGGAHAGHEGYLVDHFTGVFLMNPRGEFVQVFTHGLTPDEAARQIKAAKAAYRSA